MFQNLTTWVSGICLLILVYYMGGAAYMLDPSVSSISTGTAIALGVGVLIGSWFVYDLLWNSPLGQNTPIAFAISFALLLGISYGLTQLLSGRAAYIHVGAMLGTLMTANVWRYVVLPAARAGGRNARREAAGPGALLPRQAALDSQQLYDVPGDLYYDQRALPQHLRQPA